MLKLRFFLIAPFTLMTLCASTASSQGYPQKVVRIVTSVAGGGNDYLARVVAQQLTRSLGQQVLVENRGIIAGDVVARAMPDGHTLIAYGTPLWLNPLLRAHVTYDPVKDFSPISLMARTPGMIVVHPALPVKSVKELINLARARPNELNYAAGTVGATPHLSGELFKSMAGVKIAHVPYKGAGPGVNAVVGGEVHLMFPTANTVLPHIKSGRLRALAVTSAQPSALVPGVSTVSASGVPGYESSAVIGLFAPANTPTEIINRLNEEVVRTLNRAEIKVQLLNSGSEAISSTPEEFAAIVKSDIAKWGRLIKDLGLREN